ncbi:hypothetical protein [Methylobacterium organophilum]|uniref:hypothetical protein n=1 Tax=Methylobacterium organophilum TaxID=410 RepID=UPI001EE1EB1D|nr:hypothetical protein [Methylobacterium organophilum]
MMSTELKKNSSYEIVDTLPSVVEISADTPLDSSNGLHFREWSQPGQGCYRWSGAAERIRLPIRIDRSAGNVISIHMMRAMCEPARIRMLVDSQEVAITETIQAYGILVSAAVPPSPRGALLLEIISTTQQEGTFPGARTLGLAVHHIRVASGNF